MKDRCFNPNSENYPDYGGRGIVVCADWRNDFAQFLADVGPRPAAGLTLDRIDNDGNYEPGNVRWATLSEQAYNRRPGRRKSRLLDGEHTAEEIAAIAGVDAITVRKRFRNGYRGRDLYEPSVRHLRRPSMLGKQRTDMVRGENGRFAWRKPFNGPPERRT
jgi:hypothetical protein